MHQKCHTWNTKVTRYLGWKHFDIVLRKFGHQIQLMKLGEQRTIGGKGFIWDFDWFRSVVIRAERLSKANVLLGRFELRRIFALRYLSLHCHLKISTSVTECRSVLINYWDDGHFIPDSALPFVPLVSTQKCIAYLSPSPSTSHPFSSKIAE